MIENRWKDHKYHRLSSVLALRHLYICFMKIALLGYGKMGKIIETIALQRGHSIVLKVNKANAGLFTDQELQQADVAIEFSTPATAISNMLRCFRAGVPVVAGTTGWTDKMEYVANECQLTNACIFHASNFSLGVNLFFRLNKQLAELMAPHAEYEPSMEEIHHIHKLDSPSGTAITLADGLIASFPRKTHFKDYPNGAPDAVPANELPIISRRVGEVPGTHTVTYTSAVDRIMITHEALSRQGFAMGAVIAAEWLPGKKGIFGMNDLLG
jgi:4-hydroxy-tetrahydrodipicolinate reductase